MMSPLYFAVTFHLLHIINTVTELETPLIVYCNQLDVDYSSICCKSLHYARTDVRGPYLVVQKILKHAAD